MNTRATAAVRLLAGDKEPVRLASTANLALAGLLTVDGIVTEAGDRILVKDQTGATQNGIYTASEGTWYRATDSNSSRVLIAGMKVAVQEGATHGGDVWNLLTDRPDIGDDDIEFELYLNTSIVDEINDARDALDAATEAVIALGLGAGKASQAEAEAGITNVPWMTPLRTRQAFLSLVRPIGVTPELVTPSYVSSDHTVLLQAWLDYGVANNVPLTLIGSYQVSNTLTISGPVRIAGPGSGLGTITQTANKDLLLATSIDRISISGLKLVGNRGIGVDGFYSAFSFNNCDDLWIEDNEVTSFKGAGVFITTGCLRTHVINNKITQCQYAVSPFKGCKNTIIALNHFESIDGPSIIVDDATNGDTALTAVPCEDITIANNTILNSAATEIGYGIVLTAVKKAVVSGNILDGGGSAGSIVCTGIIVNSGQDEFTMAEDVTISGNIIKNMQGGGAMIISGAKDVTITGNVSHDNYLWPTVLNGAVDITINNDTTHTTTRIFINGNTLRKDNGELDIGVSVGAGPSEVHIGENSISGISVPYQCGTAGQILWHGVCQGALPAHQAGFRSRFAVDNSGTAWANDGSAWVKVGTQT